MEKSWLRVIFFFLISCVLLTACEYDFIEIELPPDDDNLPDVSFSAEVAPIFSETGCTSTNCHGGSIPPNLKSEAAYNSLMSLNLVIPENPEESKIYYYPHPVTGTHNSRYKSQQDANTIYAWIKKGALNN